MVLAMLCTDEMVDAYGVGYAMLCTDEMVLAMLRCAQRAASGIRGPKARVPRTTSLPPLDTLAVGIRGGGANPCGENHLQRDPN